MELYDTSDDVKGIAFELFLGKTFRGELGQFFTPRTIVNYRVEVLGVKEGDKVCDPCCGSGSFLIKVFEHVLNQIDQDVHKQITRLMEDVSLINPPFGAHVEKDVRITTSDIPTEKEKNFYLQLYGSDYIQHVYNPIKMYAEEIGKDKQVGKRILDLYDINSNSTEILFIERCINLLKPGKRAGIVLPEGILDNPALNRVREFIEKRARILNITSIPADVFLSSGAKIKPSLIFIEKYGENEKPDKDYLLTVTKVSDAGISSTGLPSQNEELPIAAKEASRRLAGKTVSNMTFTKVINRSELSNWSVKQIFDISPIQFNPVYKKVKIGDIVSMSKDMIIVDSNVEYTRLTVKLFNKGIVVRDKVLGTQIGTKRQTRVKSGQFIISKIDGKSAAFGIVDSSLDGAIVTPDFMVYKIDTSRVLPEYLELILQNEAILKQFENSSSGTTGRKRLSQKYLRIQQ